ncbi:PREDICTED: CDK5 regulatory subunit-associated protein 1, partial [Ceratosolen solmsi marchali]|uniref:CDK5RAP1-like protein n=1 Tax=Ceratosolen solmsi marchali TaxID=326594 RepID=A0AAJ6YSY0_9HYME
ISKPNHNVNINCENIPYLNNFNGKDQKVYLEIYGCQMNINDAEIICSILKKHNYDIVDDIKKANIILLITCTIRENAEQKIWNKLQNLKYWKKSHVSKIGILGCMAEHLKHKIIAKERIVDIIAGPDSYKDLPRLLYISNDYQSAINVTLSVDETYADVTPIRLNPNSKTAYVSIMRGCNNMCTYCVVPFTRGHEKSRPITNILDEIQQLSDQGIKEIILLGQNVNSYRDISQSNFYMNNNVKTNHSKDFTTIYKNRLGGLRFSDLLDKVSLINSEMRIRFTSPHPKDFPDEVLYLIRERNNICHQIHLPAQSGSNNVLKRMRRGYTKEAYLNLVYHIRSIIPGVRLSSDFIAGFCDETDEDFNETLNLLKEVKYTMAYLYAYSMRDKTSAYRCYIDNINKKIKRARLEKMIKLYRSEAEILYKTQIGQKQLILVDKKSKRSTQSLVGRNDGNIKVIFPDITIPNTNRSLSCKQIKYGDYIVVKITDANSQTLKGVPLYHSSINEFSLNK